MEEKIQMIRQWLDDGSINLFGAPFAGKDTQGERLAETLSAELIAGGEILRSYHDQEELQKILDSGDLLPVDMYLKMLLPYLSREDYKAKPLILSSVGRRKGEEQVIMRATQESGHDIKAVILLTLDEKEVWDRFNTAQQDDDRGDRGDDDQDVLKNRLNRFHTQTMPVIEFYRENNLLIEVDGKLSRDEVFAEIIEGLYQKATAA